MPTPPAVRAHRRGFTLIELLVVVIIIGLLAAIATPIFLGHRKRAYDANAKSLVRSATHAVETAASEGSYATLTPAAVQATEPSIRFDATNNNAGADEVAVSFTATGYTISAMSESGTTFTYAKDTTATPQVARTCGGTCTW